MKEYDFVFSLGFSCAVTQALRDLGMQRESLPLDWVGAPSPLDSARMVAADFRDWFNREDLRLWDVRHEHGHISRVYKNMRTGFGFSHEFTNANCFKTHYDDVREKYDRRIARFYEKMAASGRVLCVYLESPKNARADETALRETLAVLRARFPSVQVDFAYLYEDPAATEPAQVSESDGLTVVKIDYRTFLNGRLMHLCDGRMLPAWLEANVTVGDRLTPQDMRRFADQKRKAYRRSLGKNPIERWINRKLKGWYVDLDDYLIGQGLAVGDRPLWFDGDGK